jgi:hypothetical protein
MKVTALMLLVLVAFAACSSVETHRYPDADFSHVRKFFVEHRLADNNHIDEEIVAALKNLGFQASSGPLTMMPEDVTALVNYEDVWAWDFKSYLLHLNILISHPHTHRVLAVGSYHQPSLVTKDPPYVIGHILSRLFPRAIASGVH